MLNWNTTNNLSESQQQFSRLVCAADVSIPDRTRRWITSLINHHHRGSPVHTSIAQAPRACRPCTHINLSTRGDRAVVTGTGHQPVRSLISLGSWHLGLLC